jgi:hypothetical protein
VGHYDDCYAFDEEMRQLKKMGICWRCRGNHDANNCPGNAKGPRQAMPLCSLCHHFHEETTGCPCDILVVCSGVSTEEDARRVSKSKFNNVENFQGFPPAMTTDRKPPEFGTLRDSQQPRGSVNDIQVGGNHYKSEYQHWDLVINLGMHYLLGCASKYVTRVKQDAFEDHQKARHYVSKAREAQVVGCTATNESYIRKEIEKFSLANNLSLRAAKAIEHMCLSNYDQAIEHIEAILKTLPVPQTKR